MSSWFPSFEGATEALTQIGNEIGELSNKVQESLPELSNQVQGALPIDGNLFNKLTLRSDELVKEHELLEAQEKRKELVRDYLSDIFPWETKDETRAIFIDQCRSAIFDLSCHKSTFETPFQLQRGELLNAEYFEVEEEEEVEIDFENKKNEKENETKIDESSQEKLEKMLPLPLLLEHFDIDTHVGLIERLMKEDTRLVLMHSMLSGAGEKETIFWKNYFFHCAYTRYINGLSVDEIWSQKPKASITDMNNHTNQEDMADLNEFIDDDDDIDAKSVELQFEKQESTSRHVVIESSTPTSFEGSNTTAASVTKDTPSADGNNITSTKCDSTTGSIKSYEIIDEGNNINSEDADHGDMDDLEAEIARELGEY